MNALIERKVFEENFSDRPLMLYPAELQGQNLEKINFDEQSRTRDSSRQIHLDYIIFFVLLQIVVDAAFYKTCKTVFFYHVFFFNGIVSVVA